MSVRILVRDRNSRPVGKVEIFIKWSDGFSKVWADESGAAETNTTGYIKYTSVYGEECAHEMQVRDGDTLIHRMR
jgi:hypothetical protein